MRLCSQCGKPDQPFFEQAPCSCGASGPHDDSPDPQKHRPDCKCLGHDVVQFYVRIAQKDIRFDMGGKEHLEPKYERGGWRFLRNGMKIYRTRIMCRECIGAEQDRQERRRDYEKLCKNVRGEDGQTYSQMLASQ